uniref:Putative ixostatin n=1 Tax=Ixodes ricinus TaxID=34613 RepID=A0A0K8R455_IXORI
MIRMMILPLLVVLLAAPGYLHPAQQPKQEAERCSPGLGKYITERCSSLSGTFASFSECSYTCASNNVNGQPTLTTHFLPDGLPCGRCKECCAGNCKSVKFNFINPLALKKSCST